MNGWLIYRKADAAENGTYINWFIEEAKIQGVCLCLVYREQLTIGIERLEIDGNSPPLPDFVIVRTIESLLQMHFEKMKLPVFNNSQTARICNHKSYTYLEIQKLDIPIMPTVFITATAMPEIMPFPFPFIIKDATGRGGTGVYLIDRKEKWNHFLKNVTADTYVAQSTENVQPGKDVRVFVIGTEIVAAVLRTNKHDFRANFKLGGTASLFTLTKEMEMMIRKIIIHFDFGMVGIDFLLHENGQLIFNEIEDVVGSRILSATSDINLLEKYITHIKKTLQKN